MENLIILSEKYNKLQLRTINMTDLEELRLWKNSNKSSFFFQNEITTEMQRNWYQKYLDADDGYMFMIEEISPGNNHKIGCMGYRKINGGGTDLYNIIRGQKSLCHQKIAYAMYMMLSFISIFEKKISCKVLKNNPAQNWYLSIGFEITEIYDDYLLLKPQINFSCDLLIKKFKRS